MQEGSDNQLGLMLSCNLFGRLPPFRWASHNASSFFDNAGARRQTAFKGSERCVCVTTLSDEPMNRRMSQPAGFLTLSQQETPLLPRVNPVYDPIVSPPTETKLSVPPTSYHRRLSHPSQPSMNEFSHCRAEPSHEAPRDQSCH